VANPPDGSKPSPGLADLLRTVRDLERQVFGQVHPMDRNGHLVREFAHQVRALLDTIDGR
jgi:hypothetical protein